MQNLQANLAVRRRGMHRIRHYSMAGRFLLGIEFGRRSQRLTVLPF